MEGAKLAVLLLVVVIGLCQVSGQVVCADPQCITCTAGPYNCTACNNNYNLDYKNVCVDCVYGFYFNSTTRKCETCKQEKCTVCDVNRCYSCYEYYGLNQTSFECAACPAHAPSCFHNQTNNYMQVQSCDDNYFANDTRHCIACPKNMSHCIQCNNATTCDTCDDGYYVSWTTGLCVACGDHCLTCNGFGCDTCDVGYAPNIFGNCSSTTCSTAFCDSVGQMLLPERNGLDCGLACSGDLCCAGVATGWVGVWEYGPNTGSGPCDNYYNLNIAKPGCNGNLDRHNYTCFSNNTFLIESSLFQTCQPSFFALSGLTADCVVDGGSYGFSFAIVQCPDTPRCDVHCTTCINGTCRGCMDGFFVQGSTCASCPVNCWQCSSATVCTDCADGFYLNNNNVCTACPTLCSQCDSPTACTSCVTGARYNGTDCVACSSGNCTDCNNQDKCTQCNPGNIYNNVNNTCVWRPYNVTQYTFAANGTLVILGCSQGFYVDAFQRSCVECPDGCARCNNATDCTRCASDAYRNATGGCSTCASAIKDCADCDLQGTIVWCNRCVEGKGFVNEPQKCASCKSSYHCNECLSYNYNPKTGCISCAPGYGFTLEHPNRRCYALVAGANILHPSVFFGVLMAALATYLL